MKLYQRIRDIDRRVIFLFIALSVIFPLLFKISFPEYASPIVQRIFDKVESLPVGSKVLLSFDYDPPSAPELHPMATAYVRHCCERNLKMYIMALWPMGQTMANQIIEEVIETEFPQKIYGVDYLNLGFKSGGQGVINLILSDFEQAYPVDINGTSIDQIEMMKGIKNLQNMNLILNISAGFPGLKEWVLFGGDPGQIPVAGGVTAVSAPLLYPYYPQQLLGLMGGMKGAAEYEAALIKRYPHYAKREHLGIFRMGPQAVAHMVIIFFIIVGNITFLIGRHHEKREATGKEVAK